MATIFYFDQQLFLLINLLPHYPIFDTVALALSGVGTAGIVWFLLGLALFIREEKKNHWFFAPIILAGGVSWALAEKIIKPLVSRSRPSAEIGAILVGNHPEDYSFPSGHATIAFAMAVVLSKIEPKGRFLFYLLAVAISFSRIYLGKHFPLDVVAGAILGWGIGQASLWLSRTMKRIQSLLI